MPEISFQTEPAFKRISAIVEDLIAHNDLYQEKLDKQQMIHKIYNLFIQTNSSDDDVDTITEDDLANRINKILVVESVSGLLNDLTPEEMRIFDEAVKRK
ncbi:hypothetical protein [Nodularia sphaerocarpa]|uniref:hypothetical protein n=1 Tax=Nodularia sphaerocarpa TaxID=137816 RepID=UPI001EFA8FBF|nr:hypothetical protein [Nodularia sphaerocarpa]MDB9372212.1 hypothetical protein [Nodularia sphaerocarpa CS-585]MDB9376761.1 hypothetical protein [Nodularia sphaerocarpa CS-585A2]